MIVVVWLDEPQEDNTKRPKPNPVRTAEPPFNLTQQDYGFCQCETLLFGTFTRQMEILHGPGGRVCDRDHIQDHSASWVAEDAIAPVRVESTFQAHTPDLG